MSGPILEVFVVYAYLSHEALIQDEEELLGLLRDYEDVAKYGFVCLRVVSCEGVEGWKLATLFPVSPPHPQGVRYRPVAVNIVEGLIAKGLLKRYESPLLNPLDERWILA